MCVRFPCHLTRHTRDTFFKSPKDIIINGDLEDEATPLGEQSSPPVPKTTKQLAARRNQERIKNILLLAIPDEYLLKFHNVHNAKSLWAAIKSRFGGNEESKKMQKNVLKHHTNEVSTASGDFRVSTAGGINQVPSTPSSHDIAYSFLAQLTTSPQLENKDFQQMDGDDLEELDLRWQVAMLTVRVNKFIQRTGRNMDFKEKRSVSLDKSKIKCYNSHRKGHFARECRCGRSQGRRPYGDNGRSNAQTTESLSQALVAQDDLGGYDWSNDSTMF
ncbi:ribonuclease H-like domain-containing protein [Tanacetum coccineum]